MNRKSKSSPNSLRGKRYTLQEKAEVLDFVDSYNAEHGRGGQSAATRKFGLSPLSISTWRTQALGSGRIPTSSSAQPVGRALAQLQDINERILEQERTIQRLKTQFDALKASL